MQNNSKQVDFLNIIFDTFNNENINYCVMRNYETLPDEIGNDVDFLINIFDKDKVINLLQRISQKFNYKLINKVDRFGHLGLYFNSL
jgi:hypothetical protein